MGVFIRKSLKKKKKSKKIDLKRPTKANGKTSDRDPGYVSVKDINKTYKLRGTRKKRFKDE